MLQWDLVCERNYLVETSQAAFSGGVMVGALFFTSLADRIGRLPVHLSCQLAAAVIGVATIFVPSFTGFAIMRFIAGAIREVSMQCTNISVIQIVSCVSEAMRTFSSQKRVIANDIYNHRIASKCGEFQFTII